MNFDELYVNNIEVILKHSKGVFRNSVLNCDMDYDDFLQLCLMKIYNYCENFNSEKSSIKTYVRRIIDSVYKNECEKLHKLKRDINIKNHSKSLDFLVTSGDEEVSYSDLIADKFNLDNELFNDDYYKKLEHYILKLNKELDVKILILLYKGYNKTEISKELNINVRTVYRSVDNIREKISIVL